ncbi:unnamed protein product [Rhizoctonia solani]|uniref:Uncharacterized protein n=1 Tax=Rhizoctonia solani TaxID=456999 RepID=A0A8H3BUR7_9AGAM|nr:unnamed protein product [Rhizoctonia solani]
MDETKHMDNSIPMNIGDLAATIALASNALAAAAEALAEAARAMSDASSTFDGGKLPETLSGTKQPTNTEYKLDSRNDSTNNSLKDLPCLVDQHVLANQQAGPRSECEVPVTAYRPASIVSPNSDSEVGVAPYHYLSDRNLPGPSSFQPERYNDPFQSHATHGLNNKLDISPSSPAASTSRVPLTQPPDDVRDNGPQSNTSRLLEAMKLYPTIPPGRNYIYFDQDSDGLAFIAYMALQAHRIICMVPDDILDAYLSLLQSFTHAKVHCADTPEQFTSISATLGPLNVNYYDILCTPRSKFIFNAPSFYQLFPDCILHWGAPSSSYYYIALVNLPYTVRNCIMETGEYTFDGGAHGVEPYSEAVLNTCFHPNSPFQHLSQISSLIFNGSNAPGLTGVQPSGARPDSDPWALYNTSSLTTSQTQGDTGDSLPAGHYYVVLDGANDIDIIPIITYIALKSDKTICYVPPKKDLDQCLRLIKSISNIDGMGCSSTKPKKVKVAVNAFKLNKARILLRKAAPEWHVCWSKSLADFLIYCGTPSDLPSYIDECRWKVSHSLLVLTKAQYSSIQRKLNRLLEEHPHFGVSNGSHPPALYALRRSLVSHM